MCPEVVATAPGLPDHSEIGAYPSRLVMAYDADTDEVLTRRARFTLTDATRPTDFGPQKAARRNHPLLLSLKGRVRGSLVADMGDAAPYDTRLYFDRPRNVIQYNRRRGARSQILWRLPGYYEPSPSMGGLWGKSVTDDRAFLDKESKIVWRGALSGGCWISPFEKRKVSHHLAVEDILGLAGRFSRPKAVAFSLDNRAFTDFRIALKKGDPRLAHRPGVPDIFDLRRHPSFFLKFRYILCPMGHDVATQLYWVIATNSIAFKEEGEYEVLPDFFLKPWVHYVPLEQGMPDIREKFEFCEANLGFCTDMLARAKLAYAEMLEARTWEEAENKVLDRLGVLA